MRCITCHNLSLKIICISCQEQLLKPSLHQRELTKDFSVYSFYKYDEVSDLLNTKYEFYGDRVYNILASLSFSKFAENFQFENHINAIGIDDHTRDNFSHTAILVKHLKSQNIIPKYNLLKAQNHVKYAGKDLEFRKNNKRNFLYKGKQNSQVILVDDIITTGSTLLEAKETLEENNCEVLFALCISDANI